MPGLVIKLLHFLDYKSHEFYNWFSRRKKKKEISDFMISKIHILSYINISEMRMGPYNQWYIKISFLIVYNREIVEFDEIK